MAGYYDPTSRYGIAEDWKRMGLPTRQEFITKVRDFSWPNMTPQQVKQKQNTLIRQYWGPGGQQAHKVPFGRQLADQDPAGTFYRHLATGMGGGFDQGTTTGQFARNQYDEIFNAWRAAAQNHPFLRFDDFLSRRNIPGMISQQYRQLTPNQRGEVGPNMMQRWV